MSNQSRVTQPSNASQDPTPTSLAVLARKWIIQDNYEIIVNIRPKRFRYQITSDKFGTHKSVRSIGQITSTSKIIRCDDMYIVYHATIATIETVTTLVFGVYYFRDSTRIRTNIPAVSYYRTNRVDSSLLLSMIDRRVASVWVHVYSYNRAAAPRAP